MFHGCESLTHLDLSGFDTSQVRYMGSLFSDCESLEQWTVPETWPVKEADAIPKPTSSRNEWWSKRDGVWMSVYEIYSRGRTADTFTSLPSAE